jgi:hypothetical protein
MSDCIDPSLVAYADQRIASCAVFVDRMIVNERQDSVLRGSDDAIAVCALSAALDRVLSNKSAVTDALALALRRLAAQ